RVRVADVVHLSRGGRHSKQEVRPAMKLLALGDAARAALLASRVAAKDEGAAHGLECRALRLEVVELRVQIVQAEAERMSGLQPREVRRRHVLIIPEQERIAGVVVADIGPPTVDLE